MKRIALYTRRSIYSEESESIQMQIDTCKNYFKKGDYTFETFIDEGFSGSNTNRPAFLRMLQKIENKDFDAVVVYKMDRISRNMVDFINLSNKFEILGVPLISVTEGADPSTPAGKFVMNILASVAEMERANTIQRVKDNMLTMAKHGRWTGGRTPLGYKSKKSDHGTYLTINEKEREVVYAIYRKYLKCESLNQTTKYIKANYKNISICSVMNTLTSPVYVNSCKDIHTYFKLKGFTIFGEPNEKGYITYGRRPKVNNKKDWNSKDMIVAVSKHEAIIDSKTWLKVQELLEKHSGESKPKESKYSYLNNLVKCGICGSNMFIELSYVRKDGTKVYSFRCSKRKRKSTCTNGMIMVDEMENEIEKFLMSIGTNKKIFKEAVDKSSDLSYLKEIKNLTNRINKNNTSINSLVEKLILLSTEASKVVANKIESLTEENKKLESKLFKLEKKQNLLDAKDERVYILYEEVKLFNNLKNASIPVKRKRIRNIIQKIVATKNELLDITFVED
ncbi:recombinase family protein [Clostridium tetani]|uniref:recombinase family protein n=1 Tax=Clostridium tetani TaxID=1513 RepID=UPI0013E9790D|nr:recombinase family protein [Clostridium tetani]